MRRLAATAVTALAIALAVVAGGCFTAANDRGDDDDGSGGPNTPQGGYCEADADCLGAGPACCGCPEYAVSTDSEWAMACEDIECPPPAGLGCTGLVARCDREESTCELACGEIACDQSCPSGFATDASGCLTCSCAGVFGDGCEVDTDCVRVAADCCGCAQGGADTAIPASELGLHEAELDCDEDPVCPGVDVCAPRLAPICDRGTCVLAEATDGEVLPPGACGTPDLPPCPEGQACVLNSDDLATMAGVGICQ